MHGDLLIARSLTWRYVIALTLVALLTTSAWVSLHLVISQQESMAAVVNVSGRQRMLSQRTALFSLGLANAEMKERPGLRQSLRQAVDLMERSHRGLIHGDAAMGLPGEMSPTVRAMYFSGEQPLDGLVTDYIKSVHGLLALPDAELTPAHPILQKIITISPTVLVSSLDRMVKQYQLEGEAAIHRLQIAETAVWLFTLILLVLEASFIFKPFVQRMKVVISQLQETTAELLLHREHLEQLVSERTGDLQREREELAESEERFRLLSSSASDAIVSIDETGRVAYWNPAATRVFGYEAEEAIGQDLRALLVPACHESAVRAGLARFAQTGEGAVFGKMVELNALRKGGEMFPVELSISAINHKGRWQAIGIVRDVSERKRMEERIRQLAYYDPLTGLPNRRMLLDRLEHVLVQSRRHHFLLAVLFIDLDGFKHINDNLGHDVGDELLVVVAKRLLGAVRAGDTVCRQGGDEFVVVLERIETPAAADHVAEKLVMALREPLEVREHRLSVTASVGVSVAMGRDTDDVQAMLKHADVAMYTAKRNGRNCYRHFEEQCAGVEYLPGQAGAPKD